MRGVDEPPRTPEIAPALSPTALAHGMALKLKRSQRSTFTGAPLFVLDARMEVSAEISTHIQRYRLSDTLIYESSDRQKTHGGDASAFGRFAGRHKSFLAPAGDQMKGAGRTFYQLARASISAARASFALRITIGSLLSGVHVECKSLDEIIEAEQAITEAATNLKGYLQAATGYDGQEQVIEFLDTRSIPPSFGASPTSRRASCRKRWRCITRCSRRTAHHRGLHRTL